MAKVEAIKTVTSVNLKLSVEELSLLFTILGKVGGDPNRSYRKLSSSLYCAVRDSKLMDDKLVTEFRKYCTGELEFKESGYESVKHIEHKE